MKLYKKFAAFAKKPAGIAAITAAVAVVGGIIIASTGSEDTAYETAIVKRADIAEIVSVTGRVAPAENVDLAPEKSGKVASIRVAVGDHAQKGQILLSAANADLYAELRGAEANLQIETIKLGKGGRESEVNLENARDVLEDKIRDGFTKADDAVRNKADQLFTNSSSFGATIQGYKFSTTDHSSLVNLGTKRKEAEDALSEWAMLNSKIETEENITNVALEAEGYLVLVQSFLKDLGDIVNAFPGGDATYNSIVSSLKSDVSTARTNVNAALTNLKTAKQNYLATEASVKAGDSFEEALIQEERVKNMQAEVDSIKARIEQTIVRAPFAGTITRMDAELGEIVPANKAVVSVISDAGLQIEAFVPEADIAGVELGQKAEVTLDAHSSYEVFEATIASIDPAETIIDGIATYKTILQFSKEDARIKPGMTANIDIIIGESINALIIPQRAVIDEEGGRKVVKTLLDETIEEVEVLTGLRGFLGEIEILSGLKEGDEVVVFIRDSRK